MCSIESARPSAHSNTTSKMAHRTISLKLIEKRLNHLRQELENLRKKDFSISVNSEQQSDERDDHFVQYKKRLTQLLRSHEKQINNLSLWRFYRSHAIEQMYRDELRQSDESFQMKKSDFKSKLLMNYAEKRRLLEVEHQSVQIRRRRSSDNDQYALSGMHNGLNENHFYDGLNHHMNESLQALQRPTYNLRRAAANEPVNDVGPTSIGTSLKDLSIFSGTNALPLFSGIELQRSLPNSDIDQDLRDVRRGLKHCEPIVETKKKKNEDDDDDDDVASASTKSPIDVRIEDGRLWYQRAWFSRNSPILLVFDDLEIVPALVLTVGRNDLLIRRSGTNIKHRVSLSLLYDGHLAIRKRGLVF